MLTNTHTMSVIDYKGVLHGQYLAFGKSGRRLDFWGHFPFSKANNIIGNLNNTIFIPQLLITKGLLADLQSRYDETDSAEVSKVIPLIDDLIALTAKLHTKINCLSNKNPEAQELLLTDSVLTETLENLYDILRILKRANVKKPALNNQLGKAASDISLYSLQKVIDGN